MQFAYNCQIEHPVGVFLWKRLHFPILKKGFITMSAIILGHKHPDTDSIVSAIACTDLYRQRGLDVKAAAQGTPAPETAFVLERFGLQAPEVVTTPTSIRRPMISKTARSRASLTTISSAT